MNWSIIISSLSTTLDPFIFNRIGHPLPLDRSWALW
jgi:hypothetical protein